MIQRAIKIKYFTEFMGCFQETESNIDYLGKNAITMRKGRRIIACLCMLASESNEETSHLNI